jgi:1-aminocyclopropane-1-carboxylate deaminase/D-cysteine desulfhydrase-like pyridoxal-dependent ACC family enzyme
MRKANGKDTFTPVEKHGKFWFKREDTFNPFPDLGVQGGKVRQCLALVKHNLKDIRQSRATLATAASVHSPQGVIVAAVAKKFGLPCIVAYGGLLSPKAAMKAHPVLQRAHELGARVINVSKLAYSGVLYSCMDTWAKRRKMPLFVVRFGYAAQEAGSPVIDVVARQVKNLPRKVNTMAIPVGSGVTAAGILVGLARYRPGVRAILSQPFGFDRRKDIDALVLANLGQQQKAVPYTYIKGTHRYAKRLHKDVGFDLDAIYEAKSFQDLQKPGVLKPGDRVCFWVIGNTNQLYARKKHARTRKAQDDNPSSLPVQA